MKVKARAKNTLYGIPVNKNLIWDYDWSEKEYKTEKFFKWYLARVLSNGTAKDLGNIRLSFVRKRLSGLIGVPRIVREFWHWYLQT